MNEDIIIEGCKTGNKKLQKELVTIYGPYLMSICRRYAPASHHAQDLLQESFLRIFKYVSSFDPKKGNLKPWLKTITINTSLKYLKKIKIQPEEIDLAKVTTIDPTAYDGLAVDELMGVIETLPDGYKQIFNMYVIEGYSHSEISDLLTIKESTSRSNLTRAKQLLRKRINYESNTEKWAKIG